MAIKVSTEDHKELSAFMRLAATTDGQILMAFIAKASAQISNAAMKERDDVLMRWGQGGDQALGSLYDCMTNAREKLKSIINEQEKASQRKGALP